VDHIRNMLEYLKWYQLPVSITGGPGFGGLEDLLTSGPDGKYHVGSGYYRASFTSGDVEEVSVVRDHGSLHSLVRLLPTESSEI
jgi:hypothetical protein